MRFALERLSQPEIEPFTLAEMKRQLREYADQTDSDDDIEGLFKAARIWVESRTGRALVDQTWRLTIATSGRISDGISTLKPESEYICGTCEWRRVGELFLRRSPVLEVTSFASIDAAGEETEIDVETFALREPASKYPRIAALTGATWQLATELRATFRAGYADLTGSPQGDASVIPDVFKQAMVLYAKALWDEDKDATPRLLDAAEALLADERVELGLA